MPQELPPSKKSLAKGWSHGQRIREMKNDFVLLLQDRPTRPVHFGEHPELHPHNTTEEGQRGHSLIPAKQSNKKV
jgi:hypothetical protein